MPLWPAERHPITAHKALWPADRVDQAETGRVCASDRRSIKDAIAVSATDRGALITDQTLSCTATAHVSKPGRASFYRELAGAF